MTEINADPLSGIKVLLEERAACDERIKEINVALQQARSLIDARTIGVVRRPRLIAAGGDAPEPEAA